MKILWLLNDMPKILAEKLNKNGTNKLGWIEYSAKKLLGINDIQLCLVYPAEEEEQGIVNNIHYVSFPKQYSLHRNDYILVPIFMRTLDVFQPDIIHIYGTEYFHTVAMAKAAQQKRILDKTVISIQGLVSVYAQHYFANLPYSVISSYNLHDFLKRGNIIDQQKKFIYRGEGEVEALKIVPNVIGRTEWDRACTSHIHPQRRYYFCNETLRETFYQASWNPESCIKHSMFVSQSSYAIKALHQAIESLPYLIDKYPDICIYVTGDSPFSKNIIRLDGYQQYLKKRISQLNVKERVRFLGILDEYEMRDQYLKSNVFLMPSSIENSPNSLGEAMLLGVPCIAADVGGIADLLVHQKDGYLYPFDAPYMLAHYIDQVFSDPEKTQALTENAKNHARNTHDPQANLVQLLKIYESIAHGV